MIKQGFFVSLFLNYGNINGIEWLNLVVANKKIKKITKNIIKNKKSAKKQFTNAMFMDIIIAQTNETFNLL